MCFYYMFCIFLLNYIIFCALGHGVFAVNFYTEIQSIFARASHTYSHPGKFEMDTQTDLITCKS